jgi:hypothetical protein
MLKIYEFPQAVTIVIMMGSICRDSFSQEVSSTFSRQMPISSSSADEKVVSASGRNALGRKMRRMRIMNMATSYILLSVVILQLGKQKLPRPWESFHCPFG